MYTLWPNDTWVDDESFYREWGLNSIVVGADANVTIKDLNIDYTGIGHNGPQNVARQVIDVEGTLEADNVSIVNAPDRAIYVAKDASCDFDGIITGYANAGQSTPGVDVYGTYTMSGGELGASAYCAIEARDGGTVNLSGGFVHDITRASESSAASGVRVNAGGILNIDGGSISKADYGVISWGTVHLKSGSVHDIDTGDARPFDIESVSMTMGGGEIYNSSGLVGSVLVVDGKLEMSGGSIHDCTGQGVWVYASGASMEMSDASIYAITKRGGRN